MRVSVWAILFLLYLVGSVAAQTAIRGGILNGRALSLPQPEYPEEAMRAGIGGRVSVKVIFDESGSVISATADQNDARTALNSSGQQESIGPVDASLRSAAEKAAMLAKFAPVKLNDFPVKVAGRIIYNFVADSSPQGPRIGEIYGEKLNGRATHLPQPQYPSAARAVQAKGQVAVRVTIDPEGNVIAAAAVNGHPLLRAAAEEAARRAKFIPSLLGTTPTRDSGVIVYEFSDDNQ